MITGFNTDVEHDGVVYHVQTEDKGLDSPIILSLVYSGGAILASKRAPYSDLLTSGFTEEALAERLKRQHRLICAAIHSGRIEDLKRMGGQSESLSKAEVDPDITLEPNKTESVVLEPSEASTLIRPRPESSSNEPLVKGNDTFSDSRPPSPLGELPVGPGEGLIVSLLDEKDFYSGDSLTLRIRVSQLSGGAEKPLKDVAVSLKVLGTTFRPQIHSSKTQKDGIATVETKIPQFTSGRAAILVRAVAHGQSTEIRRIVHPGR